MKKVTMAKHEAVLLVLLATAGCGRSPVGPSATANHVEPPGVLSTGAGRFAGTDHVEPPGVLRLPACAPVPSTADDHVEPPGVLRAKGTSGGPRSAEGLRAAGCEVQ